jgi:hypothetical protein
VHVSVYQKVAELQGEKPWGVALQTHVAELRERALALATAEGGLRHGYDYLVAAEP